MWQNKIVRYADMRIDELKANPLNFRRHPMKQRKILKAAIDEIGFIQNVIFNERTGLLLDGHLRVELAEEQGEETIPVTVVSLSHDEEKIALATIDPISALAESDDEVLNKLVSEVDAKNKELDEFIKSQSFDVPRETNEDEMENRGKCELCGKKL